jgi:choice-of-anchor C domain-containing protein
VPLPNPIEKPLIEELESLIPGVALTKPSILPEIKTNKTLLYPTAGKYETSEQLNLIETATQPKDEFSLTKTDAFIINKASNISSIPSANTSPLITNNTPRDLSSLEVDPLIGKLDSDLEDPLINPYRIVSNNPNSDFNKTAINTHAIDTSISNSELNKTTADTTAASDGLLENTTTTAASDKLQENTTQLPAPAVAQSERENSQNLLVVTADTTGEKATSETTLVTTAETTSKPEEHQTSLSSETTQTEQTASPPETPSVSPTESNSEIEQAVSTETVAVAEFTADTSNTNIAVQFTAAELETETPPAIAVNSLEPEPLISDSSQGVQTDSPIQTLSSNSSETAAGTAEIATTEESGQNPDGSANSQPYLIQPAHDFQGNINSQQANHSITAPANLSRPGTFLVENANGRVKFDYQFDGGFYEGELGIFSLSGMEALTSGSPEFIAEASRRILTNSTQGYVVISDSKEGAKFIGSMPFDKDWGKGEYQGMKTFFMTPGDTFATMLVPNGTVQSSLQYSTRPLFSIASANPNDTSYILPIADATGTGNTFALEDMSAASSDGDYNDLIFTVIGARGNAPLLDTVINSAKEWRNTTLGQELIEYANRPGNNAPLIVSEPATQGYAGSAYSYSVRALDPDSDPLRYSLVSAPAGAVIDENTGVLTWNAPVVGFHNVAVTVGDSHGGVDTQSFELNVTQEVAPGEIRGTIWSDSDSDSVKDLAETGLSGVQVYLDRNQNGLLDPGEPTESTDEQGNYRFTSLTAGAYVVREVLPGGFAYSSPAPTPLLGANIIKNGSFEEVPHTDFLWNSLQSDSPLISTWMPHWQVTQGTVDLVTTSFAAASTGQVSIDLNGWTPGGIAQTFDTQAGKEYMVSFDLSANPYVPSGERLPVILRAAGQSTQLQAIASGTSMQYSRQSWQFTANGEKTELAFISPQPSSYGFNAGPQLDNVSVAEIVKNNDVKHVVTLGVGQIASGVDFGNSRVERSPANNSPLFTTQNPPNTATVGELWRYSVDATDPDWDALTYELLSGPDGMAVDAQTGKVVWRPALEQSGTTRAYENLGGEAYQNAKRGLHNVILAVKDDRGGIDLQSFQVQVQPPNTGPSLPRPQTSRRQ